MSLTRIKSNFVPYSPLYVLRKENVFFVWYTYALIKFVTLISFSIVLSVYIALFTRELADFYIFYTINFITLLLCNLILLL